MISRFFDAVEESRLLSFIFSFLAMQMLVLAGTWVYGWGADDREIIQGIIVGELFAAVAAWFASVSVQSRLKAGERLLLSSRRQIVRAPALGAGYRFGRVFLTTGRVGVAEFPFRSPIGADWIPLERSRLTVGEGDCPLVYVRSVDGKNLFQFSAAGRAEADAWVSASRPEGQL